MWCPAGRGGRGKVWNDWKRLSSSSRSGEQPGRKVVSTAHWAAQFSEVAYCFPPLYTFKLKVNYMFVLLDVHPCTLFTLYNKSCSIYTFNSVPNCKAACTLLNTCSALYNKSWTTCRFVENCWLWLNELSGSLIGLNLSHFRRTLSASERLNCRTQFYSRNLVALHTVAIILDYSTNCWCLTNCTIICKSTT